MLTLSMGPLKSLEGLQAFEGLKELTLMAVRVPDLNPLVGMSQLEQVRLVDLRQLSDIGPVGSLPSLRTVVIRGGAGRSERMRIATLSPLVGLTHLESVTLENVDIEDRSLEALAAIPSIRRIALRGLPQEQSERLQHSRPDVAFTIFDLPAPSPILAVGMIDISRPTAGNSLWSIYQDLSDMLQQPTNADAEELLRLALVGVDPLLAKRLQFDSDSGGVGIRSISEADIRFVATLINEFAVGITKSGDHHQTD
jgi:hypothetical protein